jgi:hypothetical protein
MVSLIHGARLVDEFKIKLGHLGEVSCHTTTDLLGVMIVL